jgi:LysR family transcriptional activator of nhaA
MCREVPVDWLNYHHLLYFWTAVREGGVSRAAEKLRLSQPTISAQVRALEQSLGHKLFERKGRTLVPTEVGRVVYRYAEDIFGLGGELVETLRGRPAGRALQLTVGVANAVPKLIVSRLLQPVLTGSSDVKVVCVEGNPEELVTRLATHALDVVISDAAAPPHVRVRVFNHPLGESGTTFFAPPALAARLRRFPRALDGAPMLLPTPSTAYRRALDEWFTAIGVRPRVIAEFEDSALLFAFGESAQAVFPAPTAIEREVRRHYGVRVIGRTDAVRERYVAVSVERKLRHPAVLALTSAARTRL